MKHFKPPFWCVIVPPCHHHFETQTDFYKLLAIFRNNHDYETLWKQIHDIIIKTLIAAHPVISHSYRTCFPSHINHSGKHIWPCHLCH